jgi:hypothetical protein
MTLGKCQTCGKKFTYYPSNRSGKFCSMECYSKYYRGENHPKYKEKVKLFCLYCGREFSTYPAWANRVRFCCKNCRIAWMREHIKEENNPNFKGGDIELTCQWCGEKFKVFRWRTNRKFCSHACYAKAQGFGKRTRFYTCVNCGKVFYGKRSKGSKHFCSKKCEGEYKKGQNNPFYKGKFSEEALKKIIKSRHARPNKAENKLATIISKRKLPFSYVGNGEVVIGGKNPDFIHSAGQRKVIELFGIYWHSPLYGKVKPTMTYEAVVRHYAEYGYECLVLWDTELQNENLVVNKIAKFIGGIKVAPNIMVE